MTDVKSFSGNVANNIPIIQVGSHIELIKLIKCSKVCWYYRTLVQHDMLHFRDALRQWCRAGGLRGLSLVIFFSFWGASAP